MRIPLLQKLLGRAPDAIAARDRLSLDLGGRLYAVGDVHGCLGLLQELEAQIVADAGGEAATVVMLGDYVDRGPDSARVLDHLLSPPSGFRRFCIAGNHEVAMLQFIEDPRRHRGWLDYGGVETLASYGLDVNVLMRSTGRAARQLLDSHIPAEHRRFLAELPIVIETPLQIFVHAGLRPGVALAEHTDRDLCMFRDEFRADYAALGKVVVHGHTPVASPLITANRVAIDTGAYFSGRLTAAVFAGDGSVRTIYAT